MKIRHHPTLDTSKLTSELPRPFKQELTEKDFTKAYEALKKAHVPPPWKAVQSP